MHTTKTPNAPQLRPSTPVGSPAQDELLSQAPMAERTSGAAVAEVADSQARSQIGPDVRLYADSTLADQALANWLVLEYSDGKASLTMTP